MKDLKIEDVRIYDPRDEGLDWATYHTAFHAVAAINQSAANAMHDGIFDRASSREVADGITLHDYLYASDGYFARNPSVAGVLFIDGRLHSTHGHDSPGLDLDAVGLKTNAFPFMYSMHPEGDLSIDLIAKDL